MLLHSVVVTRLGNRKAGDELGKMIAWLKRTGLQARRLMQERMRDGYSVYRAEFDTAAEARRFYDAFDETGAADDLSDGNTEHRGFV